MLLLLKHKDIEVLQFDYQHKEIVSASIYKSAIDMLPLPLQRILHYSEEFVQGEDDFCYILNEEGCWLVDMWLSDREIPINRDNLAAYLKRGNTARQWMLDNHSFAFTDCYWTCKESENLSWDELYQNMRLVDMFYSVKDQNRLYKGYNATLGGELEKFWYESDGVLKLCKKTNKLLDVLNAREVLASLIYEKQGYPHCEYQFVYDKMGDVVGCSCQAFTNLDLELVTAFDLLEAYNMTMQDNVYELIITYATSLGAKEQIVSDYMDLQTMVDYLITNRDRHQGNIGFLRKADTLQIISPAPIYDSGSSKHLEGAYPEDMKNTTVNGLYATELECLSHVKNPMLLDLAKLPTVEEVKNIFDQCSNITPQRKEKLLSLYEAKACFLKKLQYDFQRGIWPYPLQKQQGPKNIASCNIFSKEEASHERE